MEAGGGAGLWGTNGLIACCGRASGQWSIMHACDARLCRPVTVLHGL